MPAMSFLWLLLGQVGQDKENKMGIGEIPFIALWTPMEVELIDGTYYFGEVEGGDIMTLTQLCVNAFADDGAVPKNSIKGAFLGLYKILDDECKVPAPVPTFFSMLYLFISHYLNLYRY